MRGGDWRAKPGTSDRRPRRGAPRHCDTGARGASWRQTLALASHVAAERQDATPPGCARGRGLTDPNAPSPMCTQDVTGSTCVGVPEEEFFPATPLCKALGSASNLGSPESGCYTPGCGTHYGVYGGASRAADVTKGAAQRAAMAQHSRRAPSGHRERGTARGGQHQPSVEPRQQQWRATIQGSAGKQERLWVSRAIFAHSRLNRRSA